jgi:hypothetical protein
MIVHGGIIMQIQIVLTPAESKKLIARAVFKLPEFQHALKNGILAIHPSSSTLFLYELITGALPQGLWVCGLICAEGLTGSQAAADMIAARGEGPHDPLKVSKETWFFKKGIQQEEAPLGEILDQMTEDDVYVKGCNALDPEGKAGVLFANPAGGGGTIGRVMIAQRKKKFHILLPVGLEKLIPVSIGEASKKAAFKKAYKSMGLSCGLMPVSGKKIDERDAVKILSGTEAIPISAGGIAGGEGSAVLAAEGNEGDLNTLIEEIKKVKGVQLPGLKIHPVPQWASSE